jgi:hypothetical protein
LRSSCSGRKGGYLPKASESLWKGREFSLWGKEKVKIEPSSNCFRDFKTLGDGSFFFEPLLIPFTLDKKSHKENVE